VPSNHWWWLQKRQANNCNSQCSLVDNGLSICNDDACFCPYVTQGAAQCSQCFATVNVTAAAQWSSVISICHSEFPATTAILTSTAKAATTSARASSVPTITAAACSSQCSLINQALLLCNADSCFCPTALADGPACSQCLASVFPASALALSSAMSICKTEFPTGTTTQNAALQPTKATTTQPTTLLPVTTSSPTSTSGSSPLSPGEIGGIAGGVIGGVILLGLAGFFCLYRRRSASQEPQMGQVAYTAAPVDYQPSPTVVKHVEAGEQAPGYSETVTSARLRYPEAEYGGQGNQVEFGGRTGGGY
jgi:hypothetical protein